MRQLITKKVAKKLLGSHVEPSLGETVHITNKVGMTRVKSGNASRFALHGGKGKVERMIASAA